MLPQGDEEPHRPAPAPGCCSGDGHPHRARERPRPARRLAPRSGCERAHPRGRVRRTPTLRPASRRWLRRPADVNDARCRGSGRAPRARSDGVPRPSAGSTCATSPPSYGTPAYVARRGRLPRPRAAALAASVRRLPTSTTRARRSCARGRALGRRGGAAPRRVHRRRAGAWRCAPASRPSGSPSTATTSRVAELDRALDAGVGPDRRRLLRRDRPAGRARRASSGVGAPSAGPGHRRRRGAHPRVHRDRATRTRSSASRSPAATRRGGAAGCCEPPASSCVGLHSPHRLADLRHRRLRGRRAPRGRRCSRAIRDEHGVELPELDLGGGLGIAYTAERRPAGPARSRRTAARRSSRASAPRAGLAVPRSAVEPGRAIVGPSDGHALRGRHGQAGRPRRRRCAPYVCVDGGMSDNIRTALYDAAYTCSARQPRRRRRRRCW